MSIKLSQKHGLNPSMLHCPICNESTSIALLGHLPDDQEAPRTMLDREPCARCLEAISDAQKQGFVLIVLHAEPSPKRPAWTLFHSWHCITHEAAEKIFSDEYRKSGACFLTVETARQIGVPV